MATPIQISKADARRAMVRHHFAPASTIEEVFERLRSIQFDPIAPVGCNHDLVLQARLAGYKIGDWQKTAYQDRHIYDGWDKQASLVPFPGWPVRRIYHQWYLGSGNSRIFNKHPEAIKTVLRELTERGPMTPKEFEFQDRNDEWKDTWYGPSVTKQTLRALWHAGMVMTHDRRKGQHIYDLTERIMPPHLYSQPVLSEAEALVELMHERHRAVGLLRPNAQWEVWSFPIKVAPRKEAISTLLDQGKLIPVEVEGVKAHATPDFLTLLDQPSIEPRVIFVAPLDQFIWDRGMIGHLFGYDYLWEIYVPEAKRRWGYYVLPVLYGDSLVARVEFYCRAGTLEIRQWHWESTEPGPGFMDELEKALREFMKYCSANKVTADEPIDKKIRDLAKVVSKAVR